jgi:hypothetical protein
VKPGGVTMYASSFADAHRAGTEITSTPASATHTGRHNSRALRQSKSQPLIVNFMICGLV